MRYLLIISFFIGAHMPIAEAAFGGGAGAAIVAMTASNAAAASSSHHHSSYDNWRHNQRYDDYYNNWRSYWMCGTEAYFERTSAPSTGFSVQEAKEYCGELIDLICDDAPYKPRQAISQEKVMALWHFDIRQDPLNSKDINELCLKNRKTLQ